LEDDWPGKPICGLPIKGKIIFVEFYLHRSYSVTIESDQYTDAKLAGQCQDKLRLKDKISKENLMKY